MSTRKEKQRRKQSARRRAALAQPITLKEIHDFDCKLVPVTYGNGLCWLYPSTVKDSFYTTMRHKGQSIGPQRFALAVKLGCTVDDLYGAEAGHADSLTCVGGICCNPDHLTERTPRANQVEDRIKNQMSGQPPKGDQWDRTSPRWRKGRRLTTNMYPNGVPQAFETWLPLSDPLPQVRQSAIDYLSPNPFYEEEAKQAQELGLWGVPTAALKKKGFSSIDAG